ncbi:MAG: DUF2391 family protein [Ardenticatenales bacterium]|nr:DUF2391 family protein [Ardenticatenales bacterium]
MRGPFGIAYSPLNTMVESEETHQPLWLKELRDLARGFCGALVVALPLLYTQEMWERVRFLPTWMLLLALLLTYFANMGYILFEGYKPEPERQRVWLDALTTMGIGVLSSGITLALIGRYDFSMPFYLTAKLILLETIPTSFGASLAINQLGVRTRGNDRAKQPADDFSPDRRKMLATLLGALLFSFNIAPTEEPFLITISLSGWHVLAIVLFSLFVSYLMVFFADFVEKEQKQGFLGPVWAETGVSYLASLAISAILLWIFGYLDGATPVHLAVAHIITLGYATTLGGSAGRLIL